MTKELISETIEVLQYLGNQDGKELEIIDRITTSENNYDRHFTTTSRFKFKQKKIGVRLSGGIAMLEGEFQSFEFRADSVLSINRKGNEVEIVSKIKNSVYRMINIKVK